jgi:hypothetical protein
MRVTPICLHICIYIYILSYRVTHTYTHIYIYFKPHNASQQQQPAAAAAGCCYTFEEMEEMQASANVPIHDIYIYISGLSFKWDIQDWWEI